MIIVSTRPDGGVSLTNPTSEIMSWLTLGGAPEGYFGRINWDAQIEEMTGRRVPQDVAVRYVRGLQSGGFTDAEAYELIRDRDTNPEWTGKEVWDPSEVPTGRWYRNAWVRSQNGGPIYIHLERAKYVQFWRIRGAISQEERRRENDIELFDAPVSCDLRAIKQRIRSARDDLSLRRIWPEGLNVS